MQWQWACWSVQKRMWLLMAIAWLRILMILWYQTFRQNSLNCLCKVLLSSPCLPSLFYCWGIQHLLHHLSHTFVGTTQFLTLIDRGHLSGRSCTRGMVVNLGSMHLGVHPGLHRKPRKSLAFSVDWLLQYRKHWTFYRSTIPRKRGTIKYIIDTILMQSHLVSLVLLCFAWSPPLSWC